ncbi:Relaxin receptor 2-like 1 [Homarus americanus]|uniref:Relaxin receptor 2-like 1 n=1 Tax=Homarus americanus TaxID=6706 RepID=A0A8J5MV79_HOMAM|nr:Relaxin receptor 2-like 1 [Homarus americanus]
MNEAVTMTTRAGWRWQGSLVTTVLILTASSLRYCFTAAAILREVSREGLCEVGWFTCGANGSLCVEQRFLCDQEEDCPAGEDELNCLDDKGDSGLTKEILDKPAISWEQRHKCNLKHYPEFCLCRMETRIHCKNINLTSVPQDIDVQVTSLLLGNNSISLTAESFTRYPSLTLLFLADNRLSTQEKGSLEGLRSTRTLRLLHLSHNTFSELDQLMTLVPGLKTLFLEDNLVEELTEHSLKGLSGLETLYLRHNKIKVIYSGAFQEQRRLLELNLGGNPLTMVEIGTLRRLSRLDSLRLEGAELTTDLLVNLSTGLTSYHLTPNVSHAYFKRFRYCGYLPHIPDCWPKSDAGTVTYVSIDEGMSTYPELVLEQEPIRVSSFEHLLVRVELRVTVWVVALATLVGNLTVLGGRVLSADDNKILSLFIRNLAGLLTPWDILLSEGLEKEKCAEKLIKRGA